MLKEPEMYATPEHHEEFRSIIRDRVAAKIRELDVLAKDKKAGQTYIELQEKSRKEAQDHLETMNAAHKPAQGSEAHVVSEEENLRLQAAFWSTQEGLSEVSAFISASAAPAPASHRGEQPEADRADQTAAAAAADPQTWLTASVLADRLSSIWEEENTRRRFRSDMAQVDLARFLR